MKYEDLNSAIARYMPDRQLITFSTGMIIVPKEENVEGGFSCAKDISYFFHEWIHYIHNISTLHGIGAFVALAELWSAFRYTTDSLGRSTGKIEHEKPELFRIRDLIEIQKAARKSMAVRLPRDTVPESITIKSFVSEAAGEDGGITHLSISVFISNKHGDQTIGTIVLGPEEIIESVAYQLEKRFLERLAKEKSKETSIVPYHVLTIFSRYFAPSLSDDDILMCGLASLQSTSPVSDLMQILKECEAIDPIADKRMKYLSDRVIEQILTHEPEYLAWLDRLDSMFSYSKSMGLAVNETVSYMRRNLEIRKVSPFFELDFIENMYSAGADGFKALMDELMTRHGMCAGKQEHPGFEDEVGRDVLFDFAVVGKNPDLNIARRIMQASFDYVSRHLTPDGSILPTTEARKGHCPFYTSCIVSTRIDKESDCRTQPWRSLNSDTDKLCWYGEGVFNLSPGKPKTT
ncbi:hypothetical protein JAB5_11020 [Janthinobacterium sp. HH103]|uniref:hypothetical protein n=1 Tax=unclassified Janthinobacterium TaxID=2610881 RepID=UPI0008932217|nr:MULTISPECIES: hypothetical protein [unclassified Janthinobacterium]OEZ54246.1 hypothetical protein JAB2_54040 [Janthinobacterium sp. HH100]OEZ84982.1 hypothetical protein JAB5_11020 [Janthinobacterium sp. HH103]QOU74303.1 hypothetical protein JAB4_037660 [Janthinobacterium sp. HH102]